MQIVENSFANESQKNVRSSSMSGITIDDAQEPNNGSQPAAPKSETSRETRDRRDDRDDRNDREERSDRRTHRNIGRSLSRGITRNGASESLTKSFEAFKDYIEEYPDDVGDVIDVASYQMVRVERSEHRLDLSSLIFVQEHEAKGKKLALYYTLLLGGSNTNLPPLRDSDRRSRRGRDRDRDRDRGEIPRTAGDVYDEKYADTVFEIVSKRFSDCTLVEAGSSVLDASVNLEKDRDALENQMFYINAAIETQAIAKAEEQDPFSLNWLTNDDSLVVDMDWSGEQQLDVNKNPVRTDVLIQTSANLDDEDDRVYNENLTKVGAYLELVYSPAEATGGFGRSRRRRSRRDDVETQLVTPKLVVSTLDTNFKAVTAELLNLGLATTAPLSNNLEWTRAYTEPFRGDGVNYKDIGALNILVGKDSKYFDVHAAGLDEDDVMEYFGTLCRPDLAYAIDVAERGELTWVQEDYIAAAEGDKDALDKIMDSLDDLFDNQFSKIFKDIVADEGADRNPFVLGDRIINGWYRESRDGEKKDLRNVDLLWWLNRTGDKDGGEDALDWADTFDVSNGDDESQQIEKRIRMLQQVLGAQNVHVTGYSRQVLVDITLIKAMAEAAAACEVHIQAAVNQQVGIDRRGRGNRRIISMAGSDAGSKMFSSRRSRRRDRDDDDDDRRTRRRRR